MKAVKILLTGSLLLSACASSSDIVGPSGKTDKLISCNSVEYCYDKAKEECGRYKIINTSNEKAGDNLEIKLLVECER